MRSSDTRLEHARTGAWIGAIFGLVLFVHGFAGAAQRPGTEETPPATPEVVPPETPETGPKAGTEDPDVVRERMRRQLAELDKQRTNFARACHDEAERIKTEREKRLEFRILRASPDIAHNGTQCSTCHPLPVLDRPGPGEENRIYAGHSFTGVMGRTSYWYKSIRTQSGDALERAFSRCVGDYMREVRDFRPEQLDFEIRQNLRRALDAVGRQATGDRRTPLPDLVFPPDNAQLETDLGAAERGGDAAAGETIFRRACCVCHPRGLAGIGPRLAGRELSAQSIVWIVRDARIEGRALPADRPWAMPPFTPDRIDSAGLANLAAFLTSRMKAAQPEDDPAFLAPLSRPARSDDRRP